MFAALAMYRINGWSIPRSLQDVVEPPGLSKMVAYHRELLGLQGEEQLSERWIKNNPERALRYLAMILRYHEKRGHKLFHIAPMVRPGAAHLFVDTSVLYGIAKDAKILSKECTGKVFVSMKKEQWESMFHVKKLECGEKEFTGTIETDGVSVSVHFLRDKVPLPKPTSKRDLKKCRVLGADPGRVNLLYLVEKTKDDQYQSFKLTRGRYYHETGIKKANKEKDRWNRGIREALGE